MFAQRLDIDGRDLGDQPILRQPPNAEKKPMIEARDDAHAATSSVFNRPTKKARA